MLTACGSSQAPLSVDPLTGLGPAPTGSVVAIKVDNSPLARPYHRGLDEASLVYQELAEGGASRLLAVYSSPTPTEVGPVRSLREGDIELVQQFGRIAIAASGANSGVLSLFREAEQDGLLIDANFEHVPEPYRKAERRADATNFFTSPEKIDRARPGGSSVQDIGLVFGPLPGGGSPAEQASIRFSPLTRVSMTYEPSRGTYVVHQDGDRMEDFAPTNVVVQAVTIRTSRFVDVLGNPTPDTETVGTGAATLLRDGVRLPGTWSRPDPQAGTRFLDADGRDLALKPGPTLVLMAPAERSLAVG